MKRMIPYINNTVKELNERISEQRLSSLAADLKDIVIFVKEQENKQMNQRFMLKNRMIIKEHQIFEYTPFEKLETFNNEFTLLERFVVLKK
ncbi:unnamed protein product [Paramecium sonneborni]|uniref:Uncharacterized protein n=1 Tax=Paramecium sonneborni TaxID=65129 RepID=A0A8S1MR04_9CILI|nr:unnamed protein product [Paramecium sonneborni]